MVSIIKISPELNTNFECNQPRLEFCHKSKQNVTTQRRWRHILYFCMNNVARLLPVDVTWRFMSHIVDWKTENYKKLFFVKLHHILSSLKMVCFFLRSIYNIFACEMACGAYERGGGVRNQHVFENNRECAVTLDPVIRQVYMWSTRQFSLHWYIEKYSWYSIIHWANLKTHHFFKTRMFRP